TVDDGARVWLDGSLVIDQWRNQSETTYIADRSVPAGRHRIKIEYYDNSGDAAAIISWALVPSNLLTRARQGPCTADGILWDGRGEMFGRNGPVDLADYMQTIAGSDCKFLSRSIETWFSPPNFNTIQSRINTLSSLSGGKDFIYSLNVAEALLPPANSYFDPL